MNTIPVTLLFSDGATRKLDLNQGDNIVRAAAQAGLSLLTDCANGQCGTCTASLVSGSVEMDDYDPAVLPDEDRKCGVHPGLRFPCQRTLRDRTAVRHLRSDRGRSAADRRAHHLHRAGGERNHAPGSGDRRRTGFPSGTVCPHPPGRRQRLAFVFHGECLGPEEPGVLCAHRIRRRVFDLAIRAGQGWRFG